MIDVLGTTGDGVKAEKEPEYMGVKIFLSAARHDHYHCSLFLSLINALGIFLTSNHVYFYIE